MLRCFSVSYKVSEKYFSSPHALFSIKDKKSEKIQGYINLNKEL